MILNNYPGMGDYPTPEAPEYTTEDYRESVVNEIKFYHRELERMRAECKKLAYSYGWECVPFDTYMYILEGLSYSLDELDEPFGEEIEAIQEQAQFAFNQLAKRVARYQGKCQARAAV